MSNHDTGRLPGWKNAMLGVAVFLLCAGNGWGKAKHIGQLFLQSGKPRSGARVTVFCGKELAPLYGDSEGLTTLRNPVTTSDDGVYWFYADNGRYTIVDSTNAENRLGMSDQDVYIFDPADPQTVTATSEEAALTLANLDSLETETGSSITFLRETGTRAERKGPWRLIINKTGSQDEPGNYMLVYNTDVSRNQDGNETGEWMPRDVEDVCILFQVNPAYKVRGGFNYATAPSGPANTPPVFRDAVRVSGRPMQTAGSLLTVGEGLENTRFFRTYEGETIPFPLAGGIFIAGNPTGEDLRAAGEVWVIDDDPDRFGEYRRATSKGELHPQVVVGCGSVFNFGAAGKAFVRLPPGVVVEPGDTLVTSDKPGCAEVDNRQMDSNRIVGWALERSGKTQKNYVLIMLK